MSAIANSVPSERAFSGMNYIHSKARNRLTPARANQLQFIHMNARNLAEQQAVAATDTDEILAEDEYEALQAEHREVQEVVDEVE